MEYWLIALSIVVAAFIVSVAISALNPKGNPMAAIDDLLDQLTAGVTNDTTVHGSVKTFVSNIKAALADAQSQLSNAGVTPAQMSKLQAAIDTLKANDDDIAAAITDNTPAAPPA